MAHAESRGDSVIFRQIDEIRAGHKTQTRRIRKPGHGSSGRAEGTELTITEAAGYSVGKSYAIVPKRGHKAISDGRIRITRIRCERVQDISETDARAEGVESVAAYRALWESINGKTKGARWQDNPFVWVYEFVFEPTEAA